MKKIKFFNLTTDLRQLLVTIKESGMYHPYQSLVDFTLSSGHYHHKDKKWLNEVREIWIINKENQ
jgi:hypothetical protein